ncbi:hypothetical protein HELRODRAFT_175645 [Helobdella robusta]|uniref:Uncharacterized protein n=1 Tax=Helobdella robusta TaxID=6412 RepID=T1F9G8_HELRO|nr:hypothetical protein HELRODRAFT_175645 [Helobdella robusta]ESO00664.1 hypothetical protein HELRODRAFT_175645 [Helobdella robusta]
MTNEFGSDAAVSYGELNHRAFGENTRVITILFFISILVCCLDIIVIVSCRCCSAITNYFSSKSLKRNNFNDLKKSTDNNINSNDKIVGDDDDKDGDVTDEDKDVRSSSSSCCNEKLQCGDGDEMNDERKNVDENDLNNENTKKELLKNSANKKAVSGSCAADVRKPSLTSQPIRATHTLISKKSSSSSSPSSHQLVSSSLPYERFVKIRNRNCCGVTDLHSDHCVINTDYNNNENNNDNNKNSINNNKLYIGQNIDNTNTNLKPTDDITNEANLAGMLGAGGINFNKSVQSKRQSWPLATASKHTDHNVTPNGIEFNRFSQSLLHSYNHLSPIFAARTSAKKIKFSQRKRSLSNCYSSVPTMRSFLLGSFPGSKLQLSNTSSHVLFNCLDENKRQRSDSYNSHNNNNDISHNNNHNHSYGKMDTLKMINNLNGEVSVIKNSLEEIKTSLEQFKSRLADKLYPNHSAFRLTPLSPLSPPDEEKKKINFRNNDDSGFQFNQTMMWDSEETGF